MKIRFLSEKNDYLHFEIEMKDGRVFCYRLDLQGNVNENNIAPIGVDINNFNIPDSVQDLALEYYNEVLEVLDDFGNLDQIKEAVDKGWDVFWANSNYKVIKDKNGQYLIWSQSNNNYIGLTHTDGKTLNGDLKDFYIG